MNEQFTTRAQEALSVAVRTAATAGNPQVEPVHLLRALLDQEQGLTAPLLEAAGADVAAVRRDVAAAADALPSASGSTVGGPGLARQTYAVLSHAGEVARELDDEYVSTEHLLVGLAHVDSPVKELLG
ncbi:MAG: Clp protease N-terminal domain-containing protein, partial [Actinomycetota bacterium]